MAVLLILSAFLVYAFVLTRKRLILAQRVYLEAVHSKEEKFRKLFENSIVGMVRLSLHDWTFHEANEAFRKMYLNIRPECHKDFLSCLPPLDQARFKTELFNKGFVENFESHLHRIDGSSLWISFSGRMFSNEGYVEGVVNDITTRIEIEDRLHERAMLLEKAHDAIVVLRLDNTVQFWNPGAERLFQWTAREALGRPITGLIYQEQEESAFKKRRQELISGGEWSGELNPTRKDGSQVITTSRWTLVRDVEGNPKSILEIHTDITEKKALEAKFLQVQRLESLGILAGGIAHDLNNVLAPILLSIQFLKKKWGDAASRSHLATLETSAHRGADLVKQVLTFARGIEGARVSIQPERLVTEALTTAAQTFQKSIELESVVANGVWTIVGDPTQLHQVLVNLCMNAGDAMPQGGRLSITAENAVVDESFVRKNPEAKAGVFVAIKVTDTGTGIPSADLNKVFEPFYTTKTLGKGTGLGLSTALGIIKSHDGSIIVESKIGTGTTFTIYLPAQPYHSSKNTGEDRTG